MRAHWAAGIRATKQVITDAELRDLVATIAGWVAQIRKRGGDVVFIRMPISGAVGEAEEEVWPRARFWDVFAATFPDRAINFADEPALRDISAAEGSHLDAPEAARLSRALGQIVGRRVLQLE